MVDDENVHVAVIVVICKRGAPPDVRLLKRRTADRTNFAEALQRVFLPKQQVLHRNKPSRILSVLESASIYHENVELAVVIDIKERGPPADVVVGDLSQPRCACFVSEIQGAWLARPAWPGLEIGKERIFLVNPMCYENIRSTVIVPVADSHAHLPAKIRKPEFPSHILECTVV